jgi:hypothetical protein
VIYNVKAGGSECRQWRPYAVIRRTSGDRRPAGSPPAGGPPPGAVRPPERPGTIALNQTFGDGNTAFVDFGGAFNYAINQSHEFFPGKIPPGSHHVTVTVAGLSRQLAAAFTVNRL